MRRALHCLRKIGYHWLARFFMNYYSGGGQHSDINNPAPAILSNPKQRLISYQFMDQQFGQSKPAGITAVRSANSQSEV